MNIPRSLGRVDVFDSKQVRQRMSRGVAGGVRVCGRAHKQRSGDAAMGQRCSARGASGVTARVTHDATRVMYLSNY